MRRTSVIAFAAACAALLVAAAVPAQAEPVNPQRLLVTFRDGADRAHALDRFGGRGLGADTWAGVADPSVVAGLKGVTYVGQDAVVKAQVIPNDPCLASCNGQGQWFLPAIGALSAWDRSKGGGVTIAILDSGVDASHPDLAPKLVSSQVNYADDDTNGNHGTEVAGIAAAATDNGTGVSSVGWNAGIMPVKVLNAAGEGFTSAVIEGIHYATDHGAEIINLSLATTEYEQPLQDAINYAYSHNVLVVAAAGNNDEQGGTATSPKYPAAMDHVLAVAATVQNDTVAQFSRRGPWVDIAAPGNSLVTTQSGGGYGPASGTSLASPLVAGAAALLIAQGFETSPDGITAQLVRTGVRINDGAGGVISRLQVGQATEQATPYGAGFGGGNNVAVGEVDAGSSGQEILTGAGPGGGPHVRIYSSQMNLLNGGFYAFSTAFHGGVDLAVGDVVPESEGNEIVAAAGPGGGPHVRVLLANGDPAPGPAGVGFFAYGGGFSGGVSVAVGDVRTDVAGDEIVTGVFSGGGPHIRVFTATGALLGEWYAFDPNFSGGTTVAVGNFDATTGDEIVVGAGPGAGPHVKIFRGDGAQLGPGFYAYASEFHGGVDVAVEDTGGLDQIVTVPRSFGGPHVRLFNAVGLPASGGAFAFLASQSSGLSVAAGDDQIVVGTRSVPDVTRVLPLSAVS